jgi:hypothetical protein
LHSRHHAPEVTATADTGTTPRARRLDTFLRWGGLGLHLAVGVFPVAASGLMAPPAGYVGIWVGWAALLVVAWRLGRTRPRLVPLVPVVTVALWFAVMALGESLLGWTA